MPLPLFQPPDCNNNTQGQHQRGKATEESGNACRAACSSNHEKKPGESANAVPHYHKLCSRVSHIWGNRRGQHIRSAMDKPRPGKTTFVIMVSPLPGKYELLHLRPATASRASPLTRTVTCPAHPRALLALTHSRDSQVPPAVLNPLPRHENSFVAKQHVAKQPASALPHLHRSRPIRDVTDSAFPSPRRLFRTTLRQLSRPSRCRSRQAEVTSASPFVPSRCLICSLPKKLVLSLRCGATFRPPAGAWAPFFK